MGAATVGESGAGDATVGRTVGEMVGEMAGEAGGETGETGGETGEEAGEASPGRRATYAAVCLINQRLNSPDSLPASRTHQKYRRN